MRFKFIHSQNAEYSKSLLLRWEVLRKPLGMPPGIEIFEGKDHNLHLVALEDKKVVGSVLYAPETENTGKLGPVAVSEEYQGCGFGRKLMGELEKALVKKGIKEVYLEAQQEAIQFYQSIGYQPEGNSYEKMGILHQQMRKIYEPF